MDTESTTPRWKLRSTAFAQAAATLGRYCEQRDYSDLERGGLVQHFGLTFELAWKTLKDYLSSKGIDAGNPAEVIRLSWQEGIFEDYDAWIKMLRNRNLAAHLYDAKVAIDAIMLIKRDYLPLLQALSAHFGSISSP